MSLKRKLLISAIVMAVVPAVLIITLSALLVGVFAVMHPELKATFYGELSLSAPALINFIVIWGVTALAIVLTAGISIGCYINRSILVPLARLSDALNRLKEGDLSCEFAGSGDDEIREICDAFEDLRLRLQKKVRAELKRENHRKMLIANISHDIRTPVTAIKGYVEGIRDGIADTEEKRSHYLDTIYAKAVAIEQMVDNLSIYSKLETGKAQYNTEPTELFGFLRQTAEEFYIDLTTGDMDLNITLPDTEFTARLDREKYRRVFANIITNAIKYKGAGKGKLEISAEICEGGAVISLRDSGAGIAEKDLKHIFDEFYRADPSRNSSVKGNGLGLSICKKIVTDHGGKIWARSVLGQGTEILILVKGE